MEYISEWKKNYLGVRSLQQLVAIDEVLRVIIEIINNDFEILRKWMKCILIDMHKLSK